MSQPLTTPAGIAATAGSPVIGQIKPAGDRAADEAIVSQLQRGQWSAMETLVYRYQDRLFTTVLRIVNHPEDAADLVQETFVKAMQNISKFEGKCALYTWLFRIAVNLAISHRRAAKYRMALSIDDEADDGGGLNQQAAALRKQLAQSTEHDPASDAQMRLEHERVIAALATLEPEFRAVIVLRDIEDCDYEQMAQILEVPVGTIKSRLFRARVALREKLDAARSASA